MDKLPTPDKPVGAVLWTQYSIAVPSNVDLMRFVLGALQGAAFFTSWKKYGSYEPEEAAELMKYVIMSIKEFSMLGAVIPVIRETLDTSMLLCDGSVYNKVDYPQLWEVWPSAMKDATTLTLPDLRNLFLVGAGLDYSLADTGGEAEVTLTVDTIPSHQHNYSLPTFNVDVESVGVPDPTGVGQPALTTPTSSTGGDQPHENRPPYYAVIYAVIAKVGR